MLIMQNSECFIRISQELVVKDTYGSNTMRGIQTALSDCEIQDYYHKEGVFSSLR